MTHIFQKKVLGASEPAPFLIWCSNVGTWTPTTKSQLLSGQALVKLVLKRSVAAKEGACFDQWYDCLTGIGALATYDGINCSNYLTLPVLSQWKVHNGITSPFEGTFMLSVLKVDNWQPLVISVTSLKGSKNTTVATQQRVQDHIHSVVSLKSQ